MLRSGVLGGAGGFCSGAVVLGDLLRERVDAIVNAANSRLSCVGSVHLFYAPYHAYLF